MTAGLRHLGVLVVLGLSACGADSERARLQRTHDVLSGFGMTETRKAPDAPWRPVEMLAVSPRNFQELFDGNDRLVRTGTFATPTPIDAVAATWAPRALPWSAVVPRADVRFVDTTAEKRRLEIMVPTSPDALFRLDLGELPRSFLFELTFSVRGRASENAGATFYLSPDIVVGASEAAGPGAFLGCELLVEGGGRSIDHSVRVRFRNRLVLGSPADWGWLSDRPYQLSILFVRASAPTLTLRVWDPLRNQAVLAAGPVSVTQAGLPLGSALWSFGVFGRPASRPSMRLELSGVILRTG